MTVIYNLNQSTAQFQPGIRAPGDAFIMMPAPMPHGRRARSGTVLDQEIANEHKRQGS